MSRKLYVLGEVRVLEEDARLCALDCPEIGRAGDIRCRWYCQRFEAFDLGYPPRRCDECIAEARELVEVDDRETDEPAMMQTKPGDRVVTLRKPA